MQDINVIAKINAEAAERDIPQQLANGKHVVAEFAGLHYVAHHVFDTAEKAQHKAAQLNAEGGSTHARTFSPETTTA